MAVIYSDYSHARIGHFFGLSGWQAATLAVSAIPVFVAYNIPGRDCGLYSAGGANGSVRVTGTLGCTTW
mgnify:CR=1 FL=1